MVESGKVYPVYRAPSVTCGERKVRMILDYEQVLEIANVFFFVNKRVANRPFTGLVLGQDKRELHKRIHDAAVNCCLSLEEQDRIEREGESKNEQH